MSDKITIKKRSPLRGEDGNKVISIRIKEELLARIDALAEESNRSRRNSTKCAPKRPLIFRPNLSNKGVYFN